MPFLGLVEISEQAALEVVAVFQCAAVAHPGSEFRDCGHHRLLRRVPQDRERLCLAK
jgi:hypothetical protein